MSRARFMRSVGNGAAGLLHVIRFEWIMRLHLVAAVAAISLSLWLGLEAWEWVAIVMCIGLVMAAECMNTAIERLADRVSAECHPLIKQSKDCAVAAVTALSAMAGIVGGIVYLPRLRSWAGW